MDPVAHTLAGATLAEAGLKRATPLATPTLLIGANLPDIDALMTFAGADASLMHRRGWTHGVLAMAILPLVLVGLMLAWDRYVRRRRDPDAASVRVGPLVGLAYLATLTHPALDWLNTYGVRLLMPFDGRWFYGDALFIMDPWFWLLMASGAVLAHSRARKSALRWTVLATLASALVTLIPIVPWPAKVVWWLGIAAIVALRLRTGDTLAVPTSRTALTVLVVYIAAMLGATSLSRHEALAWATAQDLAPTEVFAGPEPARPFSREVIVATPNAWHRARVDWLADPVVSPAGPPVDRRLSASDEDVVARAVAAPGVQGTMNWIRFPYYEVTPREGEGWRVVIRDLRYAKPDEAAGFGVATVDVDPAGFARAVRVGR